MDKHDNQFIPQHVDEQIVDLLSDQRLASTPARFLQKLRHHYQEERQILESARERLSVVIEARKNSPVPLQSLNKQASHQSPPTRERLHPMAQSTSNKPVGVKRSRPFAAVLCVVLLVSTFALTFSLIRARTGSNPNINTSLSSRPVIIGTDLFEGLRFHMVTANIGWAITSGSNDGWAVVLRTTDGGQHWKQVTSKQLAPQGINELYILDETTAWLSANGIFYRTIDGGATWKPLGWLKGMLSIGTFLDQNHGWQIVYSLSSGLTPVLTNPVQQPPLTPVPQPQFIYTTSDGGNTWQKTGMLPSFTIGFVPINEQTAWITGNMDPSLKGSLTPTFIPQPPNFNDMTSMALFVTHDAGRSWEQQQLPRPAGITKTTPTAINGPTFVTEKDGSLFASFGFGLNTGAEYLYITHDGGKSWQIQGNAIPSSAGVVDLVDDQHILAYVGNAGGAKMGMLTLVNGQWRELDFHPTRETPYMIECTFLSASTGLALVTTSTNTLIVYRTNDGGKSWQKITTLPNAS